MPTPHRGNIRRDYLRPVAGLPVESTPSGRGKGSAADRPVRSGRDERQDPSSRPERLGGSSVSAVPALAGLYPDEDTTALRNQLEGLRQRLLTIGLIEQAKGMLMAYYGISADTAFAVLSRWSQVSNVKVRDLAAGLVEVGCQPGLEPFEALRTAVEDQHCRAQHPASGRPV